MNWTDEKQGATADGQLGRYRIRAWENPAGHTEYLLIAMADRHTQQKQRVLGQFANLKTAKMAAATHEATALRQAAQR